MSRTLVVTALRTERAALHRHVAGARARAHAAWARTGRGRWLPRPTTRRLHAAVIARAGRRARPALRPGDVVVATEVRDGAGSLVLPGAAAARRAPRGRGAPGPPRPARSRRRGSSARAERAALAAAGAIAVDMESARWPAAGARSARRRRAHRRRHARQRPLLRLATIPAGIAALRRLRAIGPIIGRLGRTRRRRQLIADSSGDRR